MIDSNVKKALHHSNMLGAGANARKNLNREEEFEAIMLEYNRGTLHSGSGAIVHSKKEALAIAESELKRRGL